MPQQTVYGKLNLIQFLSLVIIQASSTCELHRDPPVYQTHVHLANRSIVTYLYLQFNTVKHTCWKRSQTSSTITHMGAAPPLGNQVFQLSNLVYVRIGQHQPGGRGYSLIRAIWVYNITKAKCAL